ncbi:MAG TPA: hypothetical protein PLV33_04810 [Opitutaceae bacterium]|jgi:hypothetical protein|nr:hypothetical protein [Opitutaceae bacterium]HOG92421.1 hypothetical protein [Opitutaceae bacterium]HOR24650.1 hypothetical protein [Opitutaceae bacterium]HPK48948.1 hypothetical protein [Opitutaceae bacterium]
MSLKNWLSPKVLLVLALAMIPGVVCAKKEAWTDPTGKKFKGEPSGLLGPLAVFRTGRTTVQRFPLHYLSEADCVRFAQQLGGKAERAQDWEQSQSLAAQDLPGRVLRVADGKLVPAKLGGVVEPEFYVVFYASNSVGSSWGMMGSAIWRFQEVQKQFPTMVEGLFFGLKHSRSEHANMAVSSKLPWLVTDYDEQSRMDIFTRFSPEMAPQMVVLTRDGAPLFVTDESAPEKINAVFDQLVDLLKLMQPEDPRGWLDRVHYLKAVQREQSRAGHSEPKLVGNPLRAEVMAKYGVKSFVAVLRVKSDGSVMAVEIQPGADMPADLVAPIKAGLDKAVFVPAVKNGEFVEGVYEYRFPMTP